MWYCYLLSLTPGNATYIGATIDPYRRIRQHNREISGGAKYTTSRKKEWNEWKIVGFIGPFPSERDALQFEWKWKWYSKKEKGPYLNRRYQALQKILNDGKSTSTSKPFSFFPETLILYGF